MFSVDLVLVFLVDLGLFFGPCVKLHSWGVTLTELTVEVERPLHRTVP